MLNVTTTCQIYYFCIVFAENILLTLYFYFTRQRLVRENQHTLTFTQVWWTFAVLWMMKVAGFALGCLYYFCVCKIDTPMCNLNQPVMVERGLQKLKRIDSRI